MCAWQLIVELTNYRVKLQADVTLTRDITGDMGDTCFDQLLLGHGPL